MGARGPAPKPTNMRILEGNPSRRPLNNDEPQPENGAHKPGYLSDEASTIWDEVAPVIEAVGLLTKADADMFAAWCDATANYRLATVEIQRYRVSREGQDAVFAEKEIKALISSQRNFADLMVKFGTRFGLSSSDRSGLKVEKPKERSKWEGKIA